MIGPHAPDLFAVLGLPRRYAVVLDDLERAFHERSRLLHPDRFARATPRERRISLERMTHLNEAHRTLRDPWSRAEYLLSILAPHAPSGEAGEEFLHEQLAVREALAAARARRDGAAIAVLVEGGRAALRELEREIGRHLAGDAPSTAALRAARSALARARFHQAAIATAEGTPEGRVPR